MKISRYSKKDSLIAVFMGWNYDKTYDHFYSPEMMKEASWREATLDLRFSKSWSLLMPVVIKISNFESNIPGYILKLADIKLSLCRLDINQVYISVCNYVKWYNKQEKI